MQRLKPDVDIVLDILQAVATARPDSAFAQSLLYQYRERGGLSKKQLQGLYGKAQKLPGLPANKLATLEAIILRKHEKNRSPLPGNTPLYTKDEETGAMIDHVLRTFPGHKRALFLQAKHRNNEQLSAPEKTELKKFVQLAIGKGR